MSIVEWLESFGMVLVLACILYLTRIIPNKVSVSQYSRKTVNSLLATDTRPEVMLKKIQLVHNIYSETCI